MNHQWRMRQQLQALLDGELPEAKRARLSTHLVTCRDCAAGLRRLEAGDRLMIEARPDSQRLSPAASRALLSRALAEAAPRGGGPRRGWPLLAWGLATALIIGTASAASWYRPWRGAARGSDRLTILADLPPGDRPRSIQNASPPPGPRSPSVQNPRSRIQGPNPQTGGSGRPAQPRKETRPVAPPPTPDPPRPRRPRPYPVASRETTGPSPAAVAELADRLEIEWVSADPLSTEIAMELERAEWVFGVQCSVYSEWSDPWGIEEQTLGLVVAEALTRIEGNPLPPDGTPLPIDEAPAWPVPWHTGTDWGWHSDAAESPAGELLVTASEPPPPPVLVSVLPEDAPGFARAAAFRPDSDGGITWTQATACTGSEEPPLALVMLGSGSWQW